MDPARQKRKDEISRALKFIQSSLAYPEPEGYQDFLTQLVVNLLHEGNALFRDGEWESAVREFSEGLNVWSYAAAEDIQVPRALLESLYVNRAAAYHSLGEYDKGVKDCDGALQLCRESHRALYRKALCLQALGRHKEAYNCTTDCLLISRLDKQVNELAQELSVHLGLKNRKPYVAAKDEERGVANGSSTADAIKVSGVRTENGLNPLSSFAPVTFPSMPQSSPGAARPDALDDCELMGDDLDRLLDCCPAGPEAVEAPAGSDPLPALQARVAPPGSDPLPALQARVAPAVLPAPTPQLPPAFFSCSVGRMDSLDSLPGLGRSSLDALDGLGASPVLDALDSFSFGAGAGAGPPKPRPASSAVESLDDLDDLDDALDEATSDVNDSRADAEAELESLDDLLDELDPLEAGSDPLGPGAATSLDRHHSLDALDSFSSVSTGRAGFTASRGVKPPPKRPLKSNSRETSSAAPAPASNPLCSTHDFLQACSACYPRQGQGIYTYVHKPDLVHSCNRNVLLCRRKGDQEWTRVRPMPVNTGFRGPFVLCKELLRSGDLGLCKYGEKCTFAYNQLEIDVWTEERRRTLNRNLLFASDPVSGAARLLQEQKGAFRFLCQSCFDNKPTIISGRCRDAPSVCSNPDARHAFHANKCLVFVVSSHKVTYKKIRPLSSRCRLDLCCQEVRYGCARGDGCHWAHSYVELQTWGLQQHTGISHDELVSVSTKYYEEATQSKQRGNRFPSGAAGTTAKGAGATCGKSPNLRMKFVCALCWRDGLISEPDRSLKHCTAKAEHAWDKDRRVLLVKSVERCKWVQIRALPQTKVPLQYDICTQMLVKRKCNYSGNCTFAHSQEEKEMWTYMKNNNLHDMQQMYELWLSSLNPRRHPEEAAQSPAAPEEKPIAMPTDYADLTSDFYCRLCGKHSNSERQWQHHISSEKHKDRVFSCEGEDKALLWSYRFPGTCFQLCPRLHRGCPDGVSCDYAHSPEELQEWTERRDFLRQKLSRAREDLLIMPDESDFGKYSFLLQD